MVIGARLGALIQLQAAGGDTELVEQILRVVEVGQVAGVGRLGPGRDQTAFVDCIEPLAVVDGGSGGDLRVAVADVLGLTVEHRAQHHAPLLGRHARGDGADDAAGRSILCLDDLLVTWARGRLHDLPVGQIELRGVGRRGLANGVIHGRGGPQGHALAQPQLLEVVGAEPGMCQLMLGIHDATALIELDDPWSVVGAGVATQLAHWCLPDDDRAIAGDVMADEAMDGV